MRGTPAETERRQKCERDGRPLADAIYRSVFGDGIQVNRFTDHQTEEQTILDMGLGIDGEIILPRTMGVLGLQEKCLDTTFYTITESTHTRKVCAAQVYFVGYLTQDHSAFARWQLLDWLSVRLAALRNEMQWNIRDSKTGYISFYHVPMADIPKWCVLAEHGIDRQPSRRGENCCGGTGG